MGVFVGRLRIFYPYFLTTHVYTEDCDSLHFISSKNTNIMQLHHKVTRNVERIQDESHSQFFDFLVRKLSYDPNPSKQNYCVQNKKEKHPQKSSFRFTYVKVWLTEVFALPWL